MREPTSPGRRKPNWLSGDYHSAILRHAVLIEDNPQPCNYPPWLLPPQDRKIRKAFFTTVPAGSAPQRRLQCLSTEGDTRLH
jgi:hypothetical protein